MPTDMLPARVCLVFRSFCVSDILKPLLEAAQVFKFFFCTLPLLHSHSHLPDAISQYFSLLYDAPDTLLDLLDASPKKKRNTKTKPHILNDILARNTKPCTTHVHETRNTAAPHAAPAPQPQPLLAHVLALLSPSHVPSSPFPIAALLSTRRACHPSSRPSARGATMDALPILQQPTAWLPDVRLSSGVVSPSSSMLNWI